MRQQTVLIPMQRDALPLAPLLPIQRDRRSAFPGPGFPGLRSPVPVPRLTKLVVAFGFSFFLWLAVIAGVVGLASAL